MEFLGKSRDELQAYFAALGEPKYRAYQTYHALYAERKFAFAEISNLPKALREKLQRDAAITLPTVRQRYVSSDGSVRYLLGLRALGEKRKVPAAVEAVFMPSEGRQTVCISTQAGCAVDCQFCLTAQLGLIRNLTAGEIVAQVLLPLSEMSGSGTTAGATSGEHITEPAGRAGLAAQTNVVLMGQGEPLLNYENVMSAVRILLDPVGG